MTSNINPNDIDGAYPVAGQDNNSQGFRDNFTNTKTNFQYAADEITDLQNKVILKAALTGTTLNNNMQGSLLYNAQLQQMTETVVPLGTQSGSITLNFATGSYQTLTTNGPITLGFSNLPAAGVFGEITLQVTVTSTAHTIAFPAAVSVNTAGIQGFNTDTNVMEFAATGTYTFALGTVNGGSTVAIAQVNNILTPFNNTQEDLANGSAISLATTASYFSTTGASTATLADGADGQIKTLAMVTHGGNMVVTVATPGWGGAGHITFSAVGQGCTLQYIDSKWFCVGNNGAVFA
jgi:hypothetical protein